MKVIATLGNDKVLCEISMAEIAQLKGISGVYNNEWKSHMAAIGAEIDISKGVKVLDIVRNFDKNRLRSIKASLISATEDIDEAQQVVESLTLFDTLSGEIK